MIPRLFKLNNFNTPLVKVFRSIIYMYILKWYIPPNDIQI